LTPALSHALYYECQGITDFAVKVFMLAQARAITTGKEKLTVGIIKSVAKDCLRTAREVLDALKEGNLRKLQNCEDVYPIDIDEFIQEEHQKLPRDTLATSLPETEDGSIESHTEQQQQPLDLSQPKLTADQRTVSTPPKENVRKHFKEQPKKGDVKRDLPEIVMGGKQRGVSAYEALKEAGYIQSATEYPLGYIAK
jgi:hypothetical protein